MYDINFDLDIDIANASEDLSFKVHELEPGTYTVLISDVKDRKPNGDLFVKDGDTRIVVEFESLERDSLGGRLDKFLTVRSHNQKALGVTKGFISSIGRAAGLPSSVSRINPMWLKGLVCKITIANGTAKNTGGYWKNITKIEAADANIRSQQLLHPELKALIPENDNVPF